MYTKMKPPTLNKGSSNAIGFILFTAGTVLFTVCNARLLNYNMRKMARTAVVICKCNFIRLFSRTVFIISNIYFNTSSILFCICCCLARCSSILFDKKYVCVSKSTLMHIDSEIVQNISILPCKIHIHTSFVLLSSQISLNICKSKKKKKKIRISW